jgi:hypothetical protein
VIVPTFQLATRDEALLAIHARTWQYPGALESAVFEATGLRATAAYQRLNQLIDTEAAEAYAPVAVHRLRRVRAARLRTRAA